MIESTDLQDLAKSGWGVIFAPNLSHEVREALQPLFDLRNEQAGRLYQEFEYTGQDAQGFLEGQGAKIGRIEPGIIPYYLLLVGDPSSIPFSFQTSLALHSAVGRLDFDRPEDFRNYAEGVVQRERKLYPTERNEVVLFDGNHFKDPGRRDTDWQPVEGLAQTLISQLKGSEWKVRLMVGSVANKEQLGRLLGGEESPNLLMGFSEGRIFEDGSPEQREAQGDFVTSDWIQAGSWPTTTAEASTNTYFGAPDLWPEAKYEGQVALLYGRYSAGTEEFDLFNQLPTETPLRTVEAPFVARLPQRLLTKGFGAVMGQVDRAWLSSFGWPAKEDLEPLFERVFLRLLAGFRVGSALEALIERSKQLGSDSELVAWQSLGKGLLRKLSDKTPIVSLRNAMNATRNVVVLGDPAVRVPGASTEGLEILDQIGTVPFESDAKSTIDEMLAAFSKIRDESTAQPTPAAQPALAAQPTPVTVEDSAAQAPEIRFSDDLRKVYVQGVGTSVEEWTGKEVPGIWWVAGEPKGGWDDYLKGHAGATFRIRGKGAKAAQQLAQPGDWALVFRAGKVDELKGLARLVDTALELSHLRLLDTPVSIQEIRNAVPDLHYVKRQGILSSVTPKQWAVLRELIRFHDMRLEDELPELQVEPWYGATVVEAEVGRPVTEVGGLWPESIRAGEAAADIRLVVRNSGSRMWLENASWQINFSVEGETGIPLLGSGWSVHPSEDVPPGGTLEFFDNPVIEVPAEPGRYVFEVTIGGADWSEEERARFNLKLEVGAGETADAGPVDEPLPVSGLTLGGETAQQIVDVETPKGANFNRLAQDTRAIKNPLASQTVLEEIDGAVEKVEEYESKSSRLTEEDGNPFAALEEMMRSDEAPSDEVPSDEAPSVEVPSNQVPSDEMPSDEAPSVEVSSNQMPSDEAPSVEMPSNQVLSNQAPAEPPPPTPTPTAALPGVTIQIQQQVQLLRDTFTPPPKDRTLILELDGTHAVLRYGEVIFRSRMQLDEVKLREARFLSPREYGEALFEAVIRPESVAGSIRDSTLVGLREVFRRNNGRVRFEIDVERMPLNLRALGWEYLADPEDDGLPLAIDAKSPFYRRVGDQDLSSSRVSAPLKVLAVISDPDREKFPKNKVLQSLDRIEIEKERQILIETFEPLEQAGLVEYRILDGSEAADGKVTLETLTDALQEETHVLHLVAHGVIDERRGKHHIALERPATRGKRAAFTEAATLSETLIGSEVRLAVLETCQSSEVIVDSVHQALAQTLVSRGVPAVIGMQGKLPVVTARLFSRNFYHDLVRSGRVDMALASTRFVLFQRKVGGDWDWGLPVLHLGAKSAHFFDVDEEKAVDLDMPADPALEEVEADRRADVEASAAALIDSHGLSPRQATSISEQMLAEWTPSQPLEPPQDRLALSLAMAEPKRLLTAELSARIKAEGFEVPPLFPAQVVSAINAGKHVVFIGPPGTGKTSLVHIVCDYARECKASTGTLPTTASADWTTFDTVGGYVPTRQQTLEFRSGIFLQAIRDGRWLVVDEINRAEIDKALGELFTVLSGQQVDLSYSIGDERVRIRPAASSHPRNWIPPDVRPYDYVVHPNWRIVATMNVYDKSSLFSLSFALMRRFAFIDLGVPDETPLFAGLRRRWIDQELKERTEAAERQHLADAMASVFRPDAAIMRHRELGPAIARDMIRYLADRHRESSDDLRGLLGEAFLLYAMPQLDGLDRAAVFDVYGALYRSFREPERAAILDRLCSLYPHVPSSQWEAAEQEAADLAAADLAAAELKAAERDDADTNP